VDSFFHVFTFCIHLLHECYTPWPSYPTWFDDPNSIWWRVRIVKLILQLYLVSGSEDQMFSSAPKTQTPAIYVQFWYGEVTQQHTRVPPIPYFTGMSTVKNQGSWKSQHNIRGYSRSGKNVNCECYVTLRNVITKPHSNLTVKWNVNTKCHLFSAISMAMRWW
jgi:hypothetical protein